MREVQVYEGVNQVIEAEKAEGTENASQEEIESY